MCKWSDPFSKRVLIGRGLDHNSLETFKSTKKWSSSDYSVLKARPSKKYWTSKAQCVILNQSDRSVSMTVRFHLFPFRTQKLSSLVPKIVSWKRLVKIGSRRLEQKALREISGFFCLYCMALRRNAQSFFIWAAMFDASWAPWKRICLLCSKIWDIFVQKKGAALLDIFATMQYNVARLLRIT